MSDNNKQMEVAWNDFMEIIRRDFDMTYATYEEYRDEYSKGEFRDLDEALGCAYDSVSDRLYLDAVIELHDALTRYLTARFARGEEEEEDSNIRTALYKAALANFGKSLP